jgi:hypothetical protein
VSFTFNAFLSDFIKYTEILERTFLFKIREAHDRSYEISLERKLNLHSSIILENFSKHGRVSLYYLTNYNLKGTWQRDGFSGVFAEIGSAKIPYTKFRAVPIWASYSRRYS